MTLHECKNGLNVNKVRFFDTSQLSSACKELWDRVKIVCTQPYIKQAKFGLSFITFHSKTEEIISPKNRVESSSSIQLGSFTLRNDNGPDDYLSAGRIFAKRHETKDVVRMPESPINRLLTLHKKNLEAGKHKITDIKNNNNHSPVTNQKASKSPLDSVKPNKIDVAVKQNDTPVVQNKGRYANVTVNSFCLTNHVFL